MKFSVLMSVYFKENPNFLDRALRSIYQEQIKKPDEIILVQDGILGQELLDVISNFEKEVGEVLKIIKLSQNIGLSKALEIGAKSCSFELIARMDSDDISMPTRFEEQVNFLGKNPQIDVIGTFISEFENDENEIYSNRILPTDTDELTLFARKRCPLNHVTVMMKKSMLEKVGGYGSFKGIEDYFLWGKMLIAGAKFANISHFLVKVRAGRAMILRRGGFDYAMMEFRLQKKFLEIGFIGFFEFIRNVAIRFPIRIMPKSLRELVYKAFR